MNPKLLWITYVYVLIALVFGEIHLSSSFDMFTACSTKFRCGLIEADFPFSGEFRPEGCGYPAMKLRCERGQTTMTIKDVKYRVLELSQDTQTLKIARADFMDGICSPRYGNTSLDTELFDYSDESADVTLVYDCPPEVRFLLPNGFNCSGERGFVLMGNPGSNGGDVCRSVVNTRVEMSDVGFGAEIFNISVVQTALQEGFSVKYKVDVDGCEECRKSGGVCGYDSKLSQTTCYCANNRVVSGLKTCSSAPESGGQLETPEGKSGT